MMLTIKPSELLATLNAQVTDESKVLTAMFGADERAQGVGLVIYVVFEDKALKDLFTIKMVFAEGEELAYPSLTPTLSGAAWYEREIYDMFGIKPEGHPDLRPLVLHDSFPEGYYPLRKDVSQEQVQGTRECEMNVATGEGVFEVAVGPIHAGIIEPGHFRFSQAGEAILQLDARLFYTHRGIEKLAEGKTIEEALVYAERICGACSVANTLSFCQAVEKLTEQKVSRRAWIIRMLLAELERLYNHVGDTGNLCAGIGFSPVIAQGTALKEALLRCNESVAGNRFLRGVIVPGGVRQDLSETALTKLEQTLELVEEKYQVLVDLIDSHDDVLNRMQTTGILRHKTAQDLAMVGVGARASSIAADVRRDLPYGLYPELQFEVCVEHAGDVYARLRVREREVTESIKLIRQLLALLPSTKSEPLKYEGATYQTEVGSWGISESARGSNFHWVMLDKEQRISRWFIRSASYPNWPGVTIAVQGDIIADFPLVNKSFELCYACLDR